MPLPATTSSPCLWVTMFRPGGPSSRRMRSMQTSTPDGIRTAFSVTGMHCGSCVERVRSAALAAGFSDVQVALSSPQLVIHGDGATDELVRALAAAGYTAELLSEQNPPPSAPQTSGS
ncbi:MAG: heavy-metal-associated domain-containing protein, partial [Flavobacteriales bacterium]